MYGTHQTGQEHPNRSPDFPLPPDEGRVGIALDIAPSVHTEVPYRTDHILPPHEQCPPDDGKEDGAEEGADETFNRLFWREFDERCPTKCNAPNVGKHVITDHEGGGNPEPDEPFKNVIDDEMAG